MMDFVCAKPRRLWLAVCLSLLGISAAWMMTTPISGSPDEGDHVVRAAGVVRGQILAERSTADKGSGGIQTVPASLAATERVQHCFAFVAVSASCEPKLPKNTSPVRVVTGAGRYFPPYYLAVGAPSLAWPNEVGIYLMRLLSASICACLLASAYMSILMMKRSVFMVPGFFLAVTPEVLFLAGVINPNSVEIAAAIGFWAAVLALAVVEDGRHDSRLILRATVAAVFWLGTRQLAPLWIAVATTVLVALISRRRLLAVVPQRRVLLGSLLIALMGVCNVLWTVTESALDEGHSKVFAGASFTKSLHIVLGLQSLRYREMIGFFGWLSPPAPSLTFSMWTVLLVTLIVTALAFGSYRQRAVLAGLLAATYFLPVLIEARELPVAGVVWQGRYTLPLSVGIPLLCGLIISQRVKIRTDLPVRALLVAGTAAVAIAQVAGFLWALDRVQSGHAGFPSLTGGAWTPPGGTLLWVVVFGTSLVLFYGSALLGAIKMVQERWRSGPSEERHGRPRVAVPLDLSSSGQP